MRLLPLLLLPACSIAKSQDFNPAEEFVASNACPYECCTYEEGWQPLQEVVLYEAKDTSSKVVALVDADSKVQVITGDWHVMPQKVTVLKTHPSYPSYMPGDEYWLLNYLSEGEYRAWKDGEFTYFGASFSPWGENPEDWFELEGDYRYTWWIKVQTAAGVGWSNTPEFFSKGSLCG